ncbi:MAG: hypothetical protein NC212_03575 [Staphylococcus sp.]|nr:hypothetical protein [Staphylococcus sp.]
MGRKLKFNNNINNKLSINMILHLSKAGMIDLWRLHRHYSPPLSDATFVRNDGVDTTAVFVAEIDCWYRRLVTEGPETYLSTEDFSDRVSPCLSDDGAATVIPLPAEVVRVTAVRMPGWKAQARIVTSPAHILAVRQLHPFTRATPSHPVAIFHDGELRLYPAAPAGEVPLRLDCVCLREDEYAFDDSVLATLHP